MLQNTMSAQNYENKLRNWNFYQLKVYLCLNLPKIRLEWLKSHFLGANLTFCPFFSNYKGHTQILKVYYKVKGLWGVHEGHVEGSLSL